MSLQTRCIVAIKGIKRNMHVTICLYNINETKGIITNIPSSTIDLFVESGENAKNYINVKN